MPKLDITITFDQDLRMLLHPAQRSLRSLHHDLNRRASIKDLIESLRIPHTEIGRLIVNNLPVDFSCCPENRDIVSVLSPLPPINPCRPDLLHPIPLRDVRFMVDVNVAKLGSLLRMAGLDCTYRPHLNDKDIAETAVREGRILLSRDRNLLKRKIVIHGHLLRTPLPDKQLAEILNLYGLHDKVHPFSRCMKCNTILLPISKKEIMHRLEPLTKKYYESFFRCGGCDSIYWSGSHKSSMKDMLANIFAQAPAVGASDNPSP